MACCKAEKYGGWCKNLSTNMYDGEEYCDFHAPKDDWDDVESFNESVFQRIDRSILREIHCNLIGTIFPGAISFSDFQQTTPLPAISFAATNFLGKADFRDCVFSGFVIFADGIFHDSANFKRSKFQESAYFNECTFRRRAYFQWTIFDGLANFNKSDFSQDVEFDHNNFNGHATFVETIFLNRSSFNGSTFNKITLFQNINFFEDANFAACVFNGKIDFKISIFSGLANFTNSVFDESVSFRGTGFAEPASFIRSTFRELVDFRKSIFHDIVDFEESTFSGEGFFDETVFEDQAMFNRLTTASNTKILMREIDLIKTSTTFLETDLTNFRFERCDWPQRGIYSQIFGTSYVLHDELEAERKYKNANRWDRLLKYQSFSKSYVMVGDLYRQLKQQYKERHNEAEASKWHFCEKEMFRKRKLWRRYFPFSFSNLYKFSSGYGESPMLAGVILLGLLVVCTVSMNFLGLISSDSMISIKGFSFTPDWTKVWQASQNTIQYTLFAKSPNFVAATITGKTFLLLFSRLFIPIQAALFAFALRNKFRR